MGNRQMKCAGVALVLAMPGCILDPGRVVVPLDSLDYADELVTAPEQVDVNSRALTLETYLWRDLMPGWPSYRGLIARMDVVAVDQQPFPSDVDADRAYVIHGDLVWIARLKDEPYPVPPPDYRIERIARDGPEWGPDVTVDVVVRLRDGGGGSYFVRAPGQLIEGAY